jgi:hypothetical protein
MATSNDTTFCVYRITCFVSGKCYVGKSGAYKKRKYEHLRSLRQGTHHSKKLQRAFNKYGEASFYFEVIEAGLTEKQAFASEVNWIMKFNSRHNGFNITDGGDCGCPQPKPCVWNGIEYLSVTAAAKANGFTQKNLSRYLSKGFKCNSDIRVNTAKPVIFDGVEYPSSRAAAKAHGITPSAMCVRLRNGTATTKDLKHHVKPKLRISND